MATNTVPTKQTHTAANNNSGNTSGPYAISFDYLSEADVEVRVANDLKTQTTHYTFPTKSTIQFTSGNFPTAGSTIEIKRNTDITTPKVDFEDGSVLTESDLDNNSKHILFGMQETKEDVEGLVSTFVSPTAPTDVANGARWYDTVSGRTFVYYVDADTAQWVEANPPFDGSTGLLNVAFTQTGSNAVARTIDNKLKDVVSVKDFGAVGDGTTDDATAINNAFTAAAGKTIYFPAGTYIIGAELFPKTGTTIVGDGIQNTIIKASSSLATNITLINIVNAQEAITIRDLRVHGNESNRSSGSGGSNNIMIMSNRNILERVSTIQAVNSGILFGSQSDASEENIINNCIIEDNNGVGLSQRNCHGTIITNNRFARNGLENLTIDDSNRTICTNNRFFRHFGGIGNIGWDDSVDSKFCDNFVDNENNTNATSLHRNGICIGQQFSGTDPTTHRCIISNNNIVNYANTGIWIKDADDVNYNADGSLATNQPKEDAGAFIISNNFLARSSVGVTGNGANNTDIKVGRTTFKIIIEGNNAEDIDVDDATVTSMWGFSSDVQIGSTKHTVIDQFTETDRANDRLEPSVFVSATYSGGDLTGDPSVPLGIYAQHELKGATSTNAFAHSIMGYGLNNSAGNNDSVGTSGRARKLDVTNGIGDAAGVFGSAYQESTKDGGVMGVEGAIYQNVAGTGASDRIGTKWSTSLHLLSDSIGARAVAGIAMDSTGNNSGKHGYWNAIIIDGDTFGSGGASAGATGTVGLNCGSWSDSVGFPEHGIKFGKVKNGITFNSDVATGGYHLYSPNSAIKALGNLNVTGAILAQSTGDVSLILNADSDDNSTNKGFIDFQINEVVKGNIAINEATSNSPLEINSAVNTNIALVTGGGNVGINTNSPTEKLDVVGNIKASGNISLPDNSKLQLGDSQDLLIYHNSTHSYIQKSDGTGNLYVDANGIILRGANAETLASFTENGSAELYHNNVKRIETSADGVNLPDNSKLQLGDSQDLQLFHDGVQSVIKDNGTGGLALRGENTVSMGDTTGNRVYLQAIKDGAVSLRHNNIVRCETTSSGVNVTGDVVATGAVTAGNGLNVTSTGNAVLVLNADTDTSTNDESNSRTIIDFNVDGNLIGNIFYQEDDNRFEVNTNSATPNITRIGCGNGDNKRVQLNSDTFQVLGTRSPASNATGEAGQIAWDGNYVYVCTATNTWKRAALSTY